MNDKEKPAPLALPLAPPDAPVSPPRPGGPSRPHAGRRKLAKNGPPQFRTWWVANAAVAQELIRFVRRITRKSGRISRANIRAAQALANDLDKSLGIQIRRAANRAFHHSQQLQTILERRACKSRKKKPTQAA